MNKKFMYAGGKILFLAFLMALLLISINKVGVVAASPATHFYVDPSEVGDVSSGGTFLVNVSVAEAPDSYSWEVYISWDPDLLELVQFNDPYWGVTVDVMEGDFLDRRVWDTDFQMWVKTYETTFVIYPSLTEANVAGEITVGCSLKGDVPWASGDGWLCTLSFSVKAEGSCVLNLFDTWLADHLLAGSPTPTYYPNLDGFFYNEAFHDIAITSVTASLTAELVAINVNVKNEGNYTETSETFDVTVYADKNAYNYTLDPLGQIVKTTIDVGNEVVVGTQTVTEPLAAGATTTLALTWDVTVVEGGEYTVSAEAMGDDDTRDNLFIDGTVTVAIHDIAITNVVPSPTEVTVGENVTIDVTVKNEGQFNETFDVTVYYDNTVIDTETDVSLVSGASTTLTFTWDTTDIAEDTYTIKAEASVVPDETDTDDNTYDDGTVEVGGEAAAPDILIYVAVAAVAIVIIAAAVIYFVKIRK